MEKHISDIARYVKQRVYHAMFSNDVDDMDKAISDAINEGLYAIAYLAANGPETARKSGKIEEKAN